MHYLHEQTHSVTIHHQGKSRLSYSVRQISILLLVTLAVTVLLGGPVLLSASEEIPVIQENAVTDESLVYSGSFANIPGDLPEIDGDAFVLYDVTTRSVLFGKSFETPLPPASITKILTAILTLERLDLQQEVTITPAMLDGIPGDYSKLPVLEGETFTVEQLLYAALMISANDAAQALALTMAPDLATFSQMMNEKAALLGCTDTHFTNPYGFSDPLHVTSAADMTLILSQALESDIFRIISTATGYVIPPTNLSTEERALGNQSRFVNNQSNLRYDAYIGGKTGYTDLSKNTLAAGAEKEGRRLIGVIMGANSAERRYQDMVNLLDYGFQHFSTLPTTPEDYAEVKKQVQSEIVQKIDEQQLPLVITSVTLSYHDVLPAYSADTTTTLSFTADTSHLTITQDLTTAEIPIYRQNSDGSKLESGNITILLSEPGAVTNGTTTATGTSPASGNSTAQRPAQSNNLTTLLRVLVILLAVSVVILIILIAAEISRKKKHRNYRSPRF